MDFPKTEIDNRKHEIINEIKQIKKTIQNNPYPYSEAIQIGNLQYILSNLNEKY